MRPADPRREARLRFSSRRARRRPAGVRGSGADVRSTAAPMDAWPHGAGAQRRSPLKRRQSEPGPQQSAFVVHPLPLARQAAWQPRTPPAPGVQPPLQHCRASAQDALSGEHPGGGMQRLAPRLAGSPMHGTGGPPVQHCELAEHASPTSPHPTTTWQRLMPFASGRHVPEQQSALLAQTSQDGLHPPMGTQRRTPPLPGRQRLEQQSPSTEHTSSSVRVQGLPSLLVHEAGVAQWPVAFPSNVHCPPQQSEPDAQTSPEVRQPGRRAQRVTLSVPGTHDCPQQSPFALHVSPAGKQPPRSTAQVPFTHASSQQSSLCTHAVPELAHNADPAHTRDGDPASLATHASEQHSPAYPQALPTPRHPPAGAPSKPAATSRRASGPPVSGATTDVSAPDASASGSSTSSEAPRHAIRPRATRQAKSAFI